MSDVVVTRNTAGPSLPALIAGTGDRAALRFLEYFAINIRNRNRAGGLCAGFRCLPALA